MREADESWVTRLSKEGRQAAEDAMMMHTSLGLIDVLEAWRVGVRRIITGTGDDYYDDYYIYLGWRDILEDVMVALQQVDTAVINSVVHPIDAQFAAHTVDDGGQAMSAWFTVNVDRWYWRRVPVNGPIARSLNTEKT